MPDRKKDQDYAATPMGEMFRTGFQPVREIFGKISRRAESSFWSMNSRLNGGSGRHNTHVPDDKQ